MTPAPEYTAVLSPQPALTPGGLVHFHSMRCPLDFIFGSAVTAKAVCKLRNTAVACHSLDMASLFYGTGGLCTRCECIVVVGLHA